ncbi:hypothetical protein AJ79_05373 [Helicocarpus griseus UAMH5409]|uniref:NmrA-like domain-containing protein n=1 Tax=Helicocarpus griseus UAMH5409 TaxID=1447875 RepID=A0A2B7XNV5_9EURO|nr:hypothetical protein AJ79_05373 [Helicocarpus griseus UAMH5409]
MAPAKFLVTGSTGGLGAAVLATLYESVENKEEIVATSSRQQSATQLLEKYPGIQFRVVNYDDKQSLEVAFGDVERLFFVSTPVVDPTKRIKQHANVIRAAKNAGVGHVYYSSLAFGGYGDRSQAIVQSAHLVTETQLKNSHLSYTSIREGIYADAFPVFASWYPDTTTIYIPSDGPIAYASRTELGEASAKLMLRDPSTLSSLSPSIESDNIALLTGPRAYTFVELAEALSRATGKQIKVERVPRDKYPEVAAEQDAKEGHGKKSAKFFELWSSLLDAVEQGDAATVDPLMGELLGRKPRDGLEYIEELVKEAAPKGGYTWHQNYDIGQE